MKLSRNLLLLAGFFFMPIAFAAGQTPVSTWTTNLKKTHDPDGNAVIAYESFEFFEENRLLPGWSFEVKEKSQSNSSIEWTFVKGGGFLTGGGQLIRHPSTAAEGEKNALFFAFDTKAETYLITPPTDLRNRESMGLRFKYAANKRGDGVDELQVMFRFGPGDPTWKSLIVLTDVQTEYRDIICELDPVKDAASQSGANMEQVQFGFLGKARNGFGVCVDEIYVVDYGANATQIIGSEYNSLSVPVAAGSALNEVGRVRLKLSAGKGYYLLKAFGAEFTGDEVNDIEKLSLYRTSFPDFSPLPENYVCDLKLSGNQVNQLVVPTGGEKNLEFKSGETYLWIVVELKASAKLKNHVSFQIPAGAIKLEYFYKEGQAGSLNNRNLPDALWGDQGKQCTIYKSLLSEDFETPSNDTQWNIAAVTAGIETLHPWAIGTIDPNPDNQQYKTTPQYAFSGSRVLATAKVKDGLLVGGYPSGMNGDMAYAEFSPGFNAQFSYDVQLKMKYCLNLANGDRVRIQVLPEGETTWRTVWERNKRLRMIKWQTLSVDISQYATRRSNVKLRFVVESDLVDQESGFFIDDLEILGAFIEKDVGVKKIERPTGFAFNSSTPIRITIANYGNKAISGDIPVEVKMNGVVYQKTLTGGLAQGAEKVLEVTGLPLEPANDQNNEIFLSATTKLDGDDDNSNDSYSIRFYSYPTYNVSESVGYPENLRKKMMHWYPEPLHEGDNCSWLQRPITQLSKCTGESSVKPFNTEPPYNQILWTTGSSKCYRMENSMITGPVFNLQEDVAKVVVVAYAISPGATLKIEYTTDGTSWQELNQSNSGGTWHQNWYSTGGWSTTEIMKRFEIAKAILPIKTGKIQLRAHFEGDNIEGAAINAVEVRTLRPDFKITDFVPGWLSCTPTPRQKLKLKIKNMGPVDGKAFSCPVYIQITDLNSEESYSSSSQTYQVNVDIPNLASGAECEVETPIERNWDVGGTHKTGISIDATLKPELSASGQGDEDISNNRYATQRIPRVLYTTPILSPAINPHTHILYAKDISTSKPVKITPRSEEANRLLVDRTWEAGSTNPASFTQDANAVASVTSTGNLVLKYTVKNRLHETWTCEQTYNLTIKTSPYKISISDVQFTSQSNPTGTDGCYNASGETVQLNVKNDGPDCSKAVTVYILANDAVVAQQTLSSGITAGSSEPLTFDNVKFPEGYSSLLIYADTEDGNEGTRYPAEEQIFLYRVKVPTADEIAVYVRNSDDHNDIKQLPSQNAVVSNYTTKKLQLYIPQGKGETYKWYKGDVTATSPDQVTTLVKEGNFVDLGAETAIYKLEITQGSCGSVVSNLIKVLSDDIEIIAFTGDAAQVGVCKASEGTTDLLIDIKNNSRTSYPEGTELEFKLTFSATSATRIYKYSLTERFRQMGILTIPITTQASELKLGSNIVRVEFLTINGEADGNQENNVLEEDIRVKSAPTIAIDGETTVKRRFASSESYTIKTTSSGDCTRYEWWSNQQDENPEKIGGATGPHYTISGIPNDEYTVKTVNNEGCWAEASVQFVQTDIAVGGIEYPKSQCDISENKDKIEVYIKNSGSKSIKRGTIIHISTYVDGQLLKEYDYALPKSLAPDEEILYRMVEPGIKAKLQGKTEAVIKVEAQMQGVEDITASNNMQSSTIQSWTRPSFEMKYTNDGYNFIPMAGNGEKLNLYSTGGSKVMATLATGCSYEWSFQARLDSATFNFDDGTEIPIPHEKTKKYGKGRGEGYYYLTVTNSYGCSTEKFFQLEVEAIDLLLEHIVVPTSACSFEGNEKVQIHVKNNGSNPLDAGTELNITLDIETDKGSPFSQITLEKKLINTLPVNAKELFEIPVNLMGTGNEYDGAQFTFKASVYFKSGELLQYEQNTDNNKITSSPVYDYPDVNVSAIQVNTALAANPPLQDNGQIDETKSFTYDEEVSGNKNHVILYPIVAPPSTTDTYQWKLGGGLLAVDGSSVDLTAKTIKLKGSGEACITVQNEKGCKAHRCGTIRTNTVDLIVQSVLEPVGKCYESVTSDEGVLVSVSNAGAKDWKSPAGLTYGFDIWYTLKKDGTIIHETKTDPTKIDLSNTEYFTGGLFKSGESIEVRLPAIPQDKITGAGVYVLVAEIKVDGESAANQNNNITEEQIQYYDTPTIASGALGEDNEPFYSAKAIIQVLPDHEANYQNYRWYYKGTQVTEKPSGGSPSAVVVSQAGEYTLKFADRFGCQGSATKSIRFPAYLGLVPNSITNPTDGCSLTASEKLSFSITNLGQEDYSQPSGGIPFVITLTKSGALPEARNLTISHSDAIAPGGTVALTTTDTWDMSEADRYAFEVAIGLSADESQSVDPPSKRPVRQPLALVVEHHHSPGKVNLEVQAQRQLEALKDANGWTETPPYNRLPKGTILEFSAYENGDNISDLQKSTFEWIGTQNTEPHIKFEPNSGNKFQVKITNQHGCSTTSDELFLKYIVEYAIQPTITSFNLPSCVDSASSDLSLPVAITVEVTTADEPIPEGTKLIMQYTADDQTPVEETLVLEAAVPKDQSISYTFKSLANMKAGKHKVVIQTWFFDPFDEKISGDNFKEFEFYISPQLSFPQEEYRTSEASIELKAPPLPAGEEYSYLWNGQQEGETITVDKSGEYELQVTDSHGCAAKASVRVYFQFKLTVKTEGNGKIVVKQLDRDGEVVREVENGGFIDQNLDILVTAVPDDGHIVDFLMINGKRANVESGQFEGKVNVEGDVTIEAGFTKKSGENPTPKPNPNPSSVSGTLLNEVTCVSPFSQTLRLLNTEHVISYRVINQLGQPVLSGENRAGLSQLDLTTGHLADGVYLIRLEATDGSFRTLRAIKVR